ncbi:MAG: GNAT family N-acetyltransferase [Candidatus Coatesbacteria bacterium]
MKKIRRAAFVVRSATAGDVDAMWALERSVAREKVLWGEIPTTRKAIASRIGPLAFVAESNGRHVGHVYGVARKPGPYCVFRKGERYMEVDAAYIRCGWRSRGVGSLLLRRLLQAAKREGFRRFLVYTANKDLERAIRFYRRAGFKTWCANLFI